MANAMQFLDGVLSPEVSSILRDQVDKRRAAMSAVASLAGAMPQGPGPTANTGASTPTNAVKSWFDRRMAEAHPGWKVDQMLRNQEGVTLMDRLHAARDPAFAASKLGVSAGQAPIQAASTEFGLPQWRPKGFMQA